MLHVTAISLLILALLSVTACNSHDSGLSTKHSLKTGQTTGTAKDDEVSGIITNNPDCLPLDKVVDTLVSRTTSFVTVNVENMDLLSSSSKKAVDDDTRIQYLLGKDVLVIETLSNSDLFTSQIVGSLLPQKNDQNNCATVTFRSDGAPAQVFTISASPANVNKKGKITGGSQGQLTLISTDGLEKRTYRDDGTHLFITVEKTISDGKICATAATAQMIKTASYIITHADTPANFSLNYSFAVFLNSALNSVPKPLADQIAAKAVPVVDKSNPTPPRIAAAGEVQLSSLNLDDIDTVIKARHIKTPQCK